MAESKVEVNVRKISPFAVTMDINGELSSLTEEVLSVAFDRATTERAQTILLNFTNLEYMNSLGIGMLVRLVIRARRDHKQIVAYGLNEHYRYIFEITRLDQVIPICESEQTALAYSEPMDLPEREG